MRSFNLFIFLFLVSITHAQKSEVNLLKDELATAKTNSKKAIICAKLAEAHFGIDVKSINYYADKTIFYANKIQNQELLGKGYHLKGVACRKTGDLKEAMKLFQSAMSIRQQLGNLKQIASTSLAMGNVHFSEGDAFESAVPWDSINARKKYIEARKLYNEGLTFAQKSSDSLMVSKSYKNLGSIFNRLYDYENAIIKYDSSYLWYPSQEKHIGYGEIKPLILSSLYELKRAQEMEVLYDDLVNHFKKYKQYEQWINFNLNLANIIWTNDSPKCLSLLNAADSMAIDIKNSGLRIRSTGLLYEFHSALGNYNDALKYLEINNVLSAKVINVETQSQIKKLELKYNKEKVEKKLATEKASKAETKAENAKLWWAFGGTFFLALGIFLFLVQRQRIQRLKQKQERQKHNKQVNNILQEQELKSVEAMLEGQETERKRIAEDLHDRLGSTLSATKMYFESSSDESSNVNHNKVCELLDKAVEDARDIAHNLVSGTLSKFGLFAALEDLKNSIEGAGSVQVDLSIKASEERFHSDFEINLYRIVQEVFSNSLKHAEAKKLTIHFTQDRDQIQLIISDDGRGFNRTEVELGMGLKNIQARVSKLDGDFEIASIQGEGTTYSLLFKLNDLEE